MSYKRSAAVPVEVVGLAQLQLINQDEHGSTYFLKRPKP